MSAPLLVLLALSPAATSPSLSSVVVGGRVFARWQVEDKDVARTAAFEVASARLDARLQVERWLTACVEVELAGKPRPKDAFVRLKGHGLSLRAGRFKEPTSAIELESAWTLPTASRGLLHKLLAGRLQIGDRRAGAELVWAGGGYLAPRLRAGGFQPADEEGALAKDAEPGAVSLAVRAEVGPGHWVAGVSAASRAVVPMAGGEARRFASGGIDLATHGGGFRLWTEALFGSSWLVLVGDGRATFVAGRAVGAWRLGGRAVGERYAELYALAGALDPDTSVKEDLVWEAAVGVSLGAWRQVRVSLEGEFARPSRNTPLLLGPGGAGIRDRDALLMQLGTSF